MQQKSYSVGIIGGGFVGQAVADFFAEAKVYDKYKPVDPIEEVVKSDVLFICVPTPYEEKFDDSALVDVFQTIEKHAKEKIIVIKSTSIPGTAERFQKQYPQFTILSNPEFLTEKTSKQDFAKPDKQIVGYTDKSKHVAKEVLNILPKAPYSNILSATSAELVKYAINSYYANKVIYGNMLFDFAQSLGVDYSEVKEAFVADQRITDSHFDVLHAGYRGYGGKCLPKDLQALRDLGKEKEVNVDLLESIHEMNTQLRKE